MEYIEKPDNTGVEFMKCKFPFTWYTVFFFSLKSYVYMHCIFIYVVYFLRYVGYILLAPHETSSRNFSINSI